MNEDYIFFQSPEFQACLAAYEQMVAGGKAADLGAEDLTDVAEYYTMTHRPEEAQRCIKYAISLYPDSVDPKIFLAREEMFRGNIKEAKRIADSLGIDDDREVMFLRAELMLYEGKPRKAFQVFLDHYKLIDEDEDAAECACDFAELCKDYNYNEMGLDVVEQICQEKPDYLLAQVIRGQLLIQGRNYKKGISQLTHAVRTEPYNVHYWATLAHAYIAADDYAQADETADYAIAIDPNNLEAMYAKAAALHGREQFAEAHSYLVRLLQAFPYDAQMLLLDAQCAIDMNMPQLAIDRLSNIRLIPYPLRGYALTCIAYSYRMMGNEAKSRAYRKDAEHFPDNSLDTFFPDIYPPAGDDDLPSPFDTSSDLPF